eukprot:188090_1
MLTSFELIVVAISLYIILILLCILFSYISLHSVHQIPSKSVRTLVITYFLCLIASSISNITHYVILYLQHDNAFNFNMNTLNLIDNITLMLRLGTYTLSCIIISWFVMMKLQDTYKDTFLSVNKLFMTAIFVIYLLSLFFSSTVWFIVNCLGFWYSNLTTDIYQNIWKVATAQYFVFFSMYFISIVSLFNIKLQKFISLTENDDKILAFEINSRTKDFIIKQTNLITILTITAFIYESVSFYYWVFDANDIDLAMVYTILYVTFLSFGLICMHLSFDFNSKHYDICCKSCHYCCIHTCDIHTCKSCHYCCKSQNEYQILNANVSDNSLQLTTYNSCSDQTSCNCNLNECVVYKCLFEILNQNNFSVDDVLKYDLCEILNNFHHMLLCHDSEPDFKTIYDELNPTCHFDTCCYHIMRRQQSQHEQQFQYDTKSRIIQTVLNKLHSFYCHSYDAGLRSVIQLDTNSDISYNNFNSRNNNRNLQFTSKFNSDLGIEQNNRNIYSFGQRFKYELSDEKEWIVTPIYNTFKQELIENKTHISIDIYNYEYDKCKHYMETNHVKMLNVNQNYKLLMNHILSLLIYCDCDIYQNIWSATYRRVSLDESDESLIMRHSYFYHSSKYLRELIEFFGEQLINNTHKSFYHGVNKILYFTKTVAQFNGPLSTSSEINVAINFSNNIGMVLELKYSFSTYPLNAKFFECTSFSDYPNEKECLFIGGIPIMIITNIINVTNGRIYKKYINSLNVITSVLNGSFSMVSNKYNCDKDCIELCCQLLSHQLNFNDNKLQYPEYINSLLKEYCMNLTCIMIFWDQMELLNDIKYLLCNDKNNQWFFDFDILFTLFPNLEQIEYFNKISDNISVVVNNILDYVTLYDMTTNNLKYIIIHHTIPTKAVSKFMENNDINWNIVYNHKQIIIHRKNIDFNINSVDIKFDKINIAFASQNMIANLY